MKFLQEKHRHTTQQQHQSVNPNKDKRLEGLSDDAHNPAV
jgi:hypothetical protein